MQYSKLMLAAVLGALVPQMAGAVPTPEEAAQLGITGTPLTPMGAIRAGNKEGTIPEWKNDGCKTPAGYKPASGSVEMGGAPYVDPFAADKPLFKITAADMAKYADKLDEGTKELMRRFPQTFYMNVYPTRRSACQPTWVYENTIKNVMRPRVVNPQDPAISGAHAQIPFPIPKDGIETMWNFNLAFDRFSFSSQYKTLYVDASGGRTFIDSDNGTVHYPYWDNSLTMIPEDKYYKAMHPYKEYPPSAAGVQQLMHYFLRQDLHGNPTWSYIPGQRRVRLAPEFAYDGVAPTAGGTFLYDEGGGFMGKMNKFDFKLLGRKEMYIHYNSNEQRVNYHEEVATPNHLDPAADRWELHRVWVVQADLKPGERHVQKRKMFYIDEDSWNMATYVGVDQADKPHHLYYFHLAQLYDRPQTAMIAQNGYDLSKGAYTHWMFTGPVGLPSKGSIQVKKVSKDFFTPAGLQGGGVR